MPLDLARIEKKAISESVAEQLRLAILRGEVAIGERLPPERQLAPLFGTNRNTLREAIRSLEAQGLVVARQGDGVRVADFRQSGELSLLTDMLRVAQADERKRMIAEVLWMRKLMATEAVRGAAERATDPDVLALRRLVELQRAHDGDVLLTLQTDLEMYGVLVRAAFSMVGQLMFATMSRLSTACVEQVPAFLYVPPDYVANMAAVVDLIAAGDPDAAAERMEAHLTKTDGILLARLAELT